MSTHDTVPLHLNGRCFTPTPLGGKPNQSHLAHKVSDVDILTNQLRENQLLQYTHQSTNIYSIVYDWLNFCQGYSFVMYPLAPRLMLTSSPEQLVSHIQNCGVCGLSL